MLNSSLACPFYCGMKLSLNIDCVALLSVCVCMCGLELIVLAGNESCLACAASIAGPVCLGAGLLRVCIYIHVYASMFGWHYLFSLACFLKVASSQSGDKYNSGVCA